MNLVDKLEIARKMISKVYVDKTNKEMKIIYKFMMNTDK